MANVERSGNAAPALEARRWRRRGRAQRSLCARSCVPTVRKDNVARIRATATVAIRSVAAVAQAVVAGWDGGVGVGTGVVQMQRGRAKWIAVRVQNRGGAWWISGRREERGGAVYAIRRTARARHVGNHDDHRAVGGQCDRAWAGRGATGGRRART